jgi:carbon-monoxide dehydrogenase small subunit
MNDLCKIQLTINGQHCDASVPANETLLDFLRYRLGLVGTKNGCDAGDCGACTVILNGKAVNACLVLAIETEGATITTIEGLNSGEPLHPLQQAFVDLGAIQCGFCVPGMIMSAKALLDEQPDPSDKEIQVAIAGNLCRCADYISITKAITAAGKVLRGGK